MFWQKSPPPPSDEVLIHRYSRKHGGLVPLEPPQQILELPVGSEESKTLRRKVGIMGGTRYLDDENDLTGERALRIELDAAWPYAVEPGANILDRHGPDLWLTLREDDTAPVGLRERK